MNMAGTISFIGQTRAGIPKTMIERAQRLKRTKIETSTLASVSSARADRRRVVIQAAELTLLCKVSPLIGFVMLENSFFFCVAARAMHFFCNVNGRRNGKSPLHDAAALTAILSVASRLVCLLSFCRPRQRFMQTLHVRALEETRGHHRKV